MGTRQDSEAEAIALLERIQQYWREQGYEVTGYVKPAGFSPRLRSTVYEIETDLLNGVPRRKARGQQDTRQR